MSKIDNDALGTRMKENYENASKTYLTKRMPIILRMDGRAFHSYTKHCQRPFDEKLSDVMIYTATRICDEIQGAQIAYTQSDEISVLIHNYKKLTSESWHGNQVQKMCSVAAGIASSEFTAASGSIWHDGKIRPAIFDARVFVLPEAEVNNYFLWRQKDAIRNSIQMLARSLYSHKECDNKNRDELKAMCVAKGCDWDNLATRWQRGVCIKRFAINTDLKPSWNADLKIPIFSDNKNYIEKYLETEEE